MFTILRTVRLLPEAFVAGMSEIRRLTLAAVHTATAR